MNIIGAAKALNEGKKIRRIAWFDNNIYINRNGFDDLIVDKDNNRINFSIDDLLALDWMVYEEKSPMELAWMKMSPYKTLADPFDKEDFYSRKIFEYGWNEAEKHFKSQQ